MSLHVSERVHIMPVGYEHSRIVDSAEDYKADRVVLLHHIENDDAGEEYWNRVTSTLDERGIEYEEVPVDIFDLYDSLGVIASNIYENQENDVYVNITTGSKITAVAGMIATMVTGAHAYYVKAEDYGDEPVGIEDVFELPHYPIEAPEDQQVKTLAILIALEEKEKYPTKGELIHVAQHNKFEFIQNSSGNKDNYRILDKHVLNPLEERGYIESMKEGRNKRVRITDDGRGAYQAFQALVDTDDLDIELGTLEEEE